MAGSQRRAQYRVEVNGSLDLAVTLHGPKGGAMHGKLLDLSASGAGVLFSDARPNLAVGDTVDLVFDSSELDRPLVVEALIRHRAEERAGGRRYTFEFIHPDEQAKRLIPSLRGLFNRRRSPRVEPPAGQRVTATMEAPDGSVAEVRLVDLSELGAGVSIEVEFESQFTDSTRVTLCLELPGIEGGISVSGDIRNRRLLRDRVVYGIEFDADRSEDFEETRRAIGQYVGRRLQDLLKSPDARQRPAA